MNRTPTILLCLIAALAISACSTKPRKFSASVQPSATVVAGQNEGLAFSTCDSLVRKGHKGNFASAAASGAAGGAALVGSAAVVAASGTVGMTGATTTGYALSAAVPVLGIAAAFGVNRAIRAGRERKYKRTMGMCMAELGYDVLDWSKTPKKQISTASLIAGPGESAETSPAAPGSVEAGLVPAGSN